jgi:hypothetical protein
VLVLGFVSLVVPIPHREREGITVAGVSLGVEIHREENVPPVLSAVLILAGIAAIVAGKARRS